MVIKVPSWIRLGFQEGEARLLYLVLHYGAVLELCTGITAGKREEALAHIEAFRRDERQFCKWLDFTARYAEGMARSDAEREEIRSEEAELRRKYEETRQKLQKVIERYLTDKPVDGRPLYLDREIVP
jgi:hypothetical protein